MVFVLGERDCLLVAFYDMLEEQRAVLDEVAAAAVCLGPLADDGWRYIVEFAGRRCASKRLRKSSQSFS